MRAPARSTRSSMRAATLRTIWSLSDSPPSRLSRIVLVISPSQCVRLSVQVYWYCTGYLFYDTPIPFKLPVIKGACAMNLLPTRAELDAAATIVYGAMPATPQFSWPLLNEALGTEAWVKHENHTPTGAFKVRGGLVYLNGLLEREPGVAGIVSATRGNHGQSIAFAARRHGVKATIVVPHGNSVEKNAAM